MTRVPHDQAFARWLRLLSVTASAAPPAPSPVGMPVAFARADVGK